MHAGTQHLVASPPVFRALGRELAGLAPAQPWRFVDLVAGSSGLQSATTPFYAAIRANDLSRLQEAVTAGGVDAVDEQGRTPLMHAAALGSLEAVRMLIERGAK